MSSPMTCDLYEYAQKHWPAVAEHLAWLDREIADHQTAALNLLRTRLAVLQNLYDSKGLDAIVQPEPPKIIDEQIFPWSRKE